MAGDFVMVQCATPRKPEVLRIAAMLGIEPAHAFGLCVVAWIWFDEQTEDGRAFGATDSMLDAVVGRDGFANALIDVGWLHVREGALQAPNFDHHMGQSAKKRAKNTLRQQKRRRAPVTLSSRTKRDKSATKEEKRREESKPLPLCLQSPDFENAWLDWIRHRQELKKPLKPTTESAQIDMLAGLGCARAVAMIRHTIAMGWQGLREPENGHVAARFEPPKPPTIVPEKIKPMMPT